MAASVGPLGGSAGGEVSLVAECDPATSTECATLLAPATLLLPGGGTILQNRFWWFGTPNPTPPPQTVVFQFYPLTLIPGFLQPFFGWFENINFEACIAGLTLQIGPYGTVSGSYSRGCD